MFFSLKLFFCQKKVKHNLAYLAYGRGTGGAWASPLSQMILRCAAKMFLLPAKTTTPSPQAFLPMPWPFQMHARVLGAPPLIPGPGLAVYTLDQAGNDSGWLVWSSHSSRDTGGTLAARVWLPLGCRMVLHVCSIVQQISGDNGCLQWWSYVWSDQ